MPVKTSSCVFSEEKIYPGHGVNFVRRDGKKLLFINCKTRHMFLAGRKALNYRWTKSWRRAHKKESILRSVKKDKGRRTLKSERGIEGLSLQELLRKKNATAEQRKAALAAKKAAGAGKPATKAAKKADLNSRLRELRKKRKEKEEQKSAPSQQQKKGGKKKGGKKSQPQKGGKKGKKKGGKK